MEQYIYKDETMLEKFIIDIKAWQKKICILKV